MHFVALMVLESREAREERETVAEVREQHQSDASQFSDMTCHLFTYNHTERPFSDVLILFTCLV
jgi:hypothetical protein